MEVQSKLSLQPHSKKESAQPTELDLAVSKALLDIQGSNSELAGDLRLLQIRGARQVELANGRKAIIVLVPPMQIKSWRRIQLRVVRELEKKLGGGGERSVILVGHRRISPKPSHNSKTLRPYSRTVTAVHEAWLEDLVYPTEIVGKRIRVKTDGSRLIKVLLDPKDQTTLEGKVDTMSAVYQSLTGKSIVFEFPPLSTVGEEDVRRK